MYLHVILNRSENEITMQVIRVQEEGCLDGDFLAQTKRDMQFLSITDVELRMSKESLKAVLLKKVNEAFSIPNFESQPTLKGKCISVHYM